MHMIMVVPLVKHIVLSSRFFFWKILSFVISWMGDPWVVTLAVVQQGKQFLLLFIWLQCQKDHLVNRLTPGIFSALCGFLIPTVVKYLLLLWFQRLLSAGRWHQLIHYRFLKKSWSFPVYDFSWSFVPYTPFLVQYEAPLADWTYLLRGRKCPCEKPLYTIEFRDSNFWNDRFSSNFNRRDCLWWLCSQGLNLWRGF